MTSNSPKHRALTVTVGLINGQFRGGTLATFTPQLAELILVNDGVGGEPPSRHVVPTETVAYVAFHRAVGERVHSNDGTPVVVTLADGSSFRVRVGESDRGGAGFNAMPDDPVSHYREFFFFHAGVRTMELAKPMGEMLVDRGVVSAEQVEDALATQVSNRFRMLGEILVEQSKVSAESVNTAIARQSQRPGRIGEILIDDGAVTESDVDSALDVQRLRRGKRIGEILVGNGALSETELARTLAEKYHLKFVDLDHHPIDPAAAVALPRALIEKHQVLPIATEGTWLTVALGDPLAIEALDDVARQAHRRIRKLVATPSQVERHIRALLGKVDDNDGASIGTILRADPALAVEAGGVVQRLVQQIVIDAHRRGASDIHIEPAGPDAPTVVRFRIDGDCVKYHELPGSHGSSLVSRLKILAGLDITERRRAQDGKLKVQTLDRTLEVRVATIPTVGGNEDAVLRVLADSKPMAIASSGLSPRNFRELMALVSRPYGLILCVGPTGSGKTTTLHSVLGHLNTPDMKIWTAEDPVEITQAGLRQVQVHPKIGVTFATALRSFLRADPDVIMVGEMRDHETASIAVEASLTGHLVLSTLHTNSAPETVTRLLDMGLDPFSFADALLGVLAQRLARGLCLACRAPFKATADERERYAIAYGPDAFALLYPPGTDVRVWRAPGCVACGGSGYKGRVALHELLVSDDALRGALTRKRTVEEIRALAIAGGMTTLVQDGVVKAIEGRTDLTQVLAVANK